MKTIKQTLWIKYVSIFLCYVKHFGHLVRGQLVNEFMVVETTCFDIVKMMIALFGTHAVRYKLATQSAFYTLF